MKGGKKSLEGLPVFVSLHCHTSRSDAYEVPSWSQHLCLSRERGSMEATQLLRVPIAAPMISKGFLSWMPQGTHLIYWHLLQSTCHTTNPYGMHGLSRCVTGPQSYWWGETREYYFKFSPGCSAFPQARTLLNTPGWPPNPEGELQLVTLGSSIMLPLLFPSLQNFIKLCILAKFILSLSLQNQICCT